MGLPDISPLFLGVGSPPSQVLQRALTISCSIKAKKAAGIRKSRLLIVISNIIHFIASFVGRKGLV